MNFNQLINLFETNPNRETDEKQKNSSGKTIRLQNEKCWAGYVRKGTKLLFGKKYPNCVKKKKKKKKN